MTQLSILVPHFNDPYGFELSLKTVETQTWRGSREIIVYDDGSTRRNLTLLEEVISKSPERIRLLVNRVNRGRPYARNELLDAADGKFTTWLDAGDEWYPDKIEVQLEGLYRARFAGKTGPIWCTCNADWQWEGSMRKKLIRQKVDDDPVANLFTGDLRAYLWTLVGETRTFKDVGYFDLALPRLQDLDFFIRFAAKGGQFVMAPTNAPLCVYHKSDVGRAGAEVLRSSQHIFRKHSALLMRRSRKFRRMRRYQQYHLAARFTQNNGETARTALYLGSAALLNPVAFARWFAKTKGQL
jgi:glycosyltransferase involved in cell wall biosynthesis